jgi:hypothetical protein
MKIKIQITVESDKGQPEVVQEVASLDRGILSFWVRPNSSPASNIGAPILRWFWELEHGEAEQRNIAQVLACRWLLQY